MSTVAIIFILYLLFLIIVGLMSIKYNKSQEDYLLAGRRLGPWVTAFSERASGESAWLLLALPGAAISVGLGEVWTTGYLLRSPDDRQGTRRKNRKSNSGLGSRCTVIPEN